MDKLPIAGALMVLVVLYGCADARASKGPDPWRDPKTVARTLPAVPPDHPGNVFTLGEQIAITGPANAAKWQMTDDAKKPVAEGNVVAEGNGNKVAAPNIGIGWYRIDFSDATGAACGFTTAAVIAPLRAPTPQDSPICLDIASAWFGRDNSAKQERFAYLASLAGVNWARDRMTWADIEPERGQFVDHTTYDTSADIQSKRGLKVLQVFHATPKWAVDPKLDGDNSWRRFPRDLRDEHDFCKAMAARYKGRVLAWEPWNEANGADFGGQLIDEMCSLQKAAYWGLKSGNPDGVVCWNVFAGGGTPSQSEGVIRNEAWPYFETYNVHTYDPPEAYLHVFEHARDAASGRPIWLSECGIGLHFTKGSKEGELTPDLELHQARFIAQSYASSLFAGINRHFFFILGNYLENVNQFGIIRYDQTPRPGYVALAAVGRLLAGAKPLGRLAPVDKDGPYVYAFRAVPDGKERDVLVTWAEKSLNNPVPSSTKTEGVFDYLGRPCAFPAQLSPAASYLVLPAGGARQLKLEPVPGAAGYRAGAPSPVVLQLIMPESDTDLKTQAHRIESGKESAIKIVAYNFGLAPVRGTFQLEDAPAAWHAALNPGAIELAASERKALLLLQVTIPDGDKEARWVTLRGDFGTAGCPVLAFRLCAKQG